MPIKIGSVYNVRFKSGNTHTAFSWPSKIPASGNRYMKHKVIKITKKLNPKDSLDYDYVGDVYDKIDGAVELKNIKIVSKQLILKSSPFKVAGKGKKYKKRTKKKSKKRSNKKTSRKTRRSSRKTRKTKKRKMKGGAHNYTVDHEEQGYTENEKGPVVYSFNLLYNGITIVNINYSYSEFLSLKKNLETSAHGDGKKYIAELAFPRKTMSWFGKTKHWTRLHERRDLLKAWLEGVWARSQDMVNMLSKAVAKWGGDPPLQPRALRYLMLERLTRFIKFPIFKPISLAGTGSFGNVYRVSKVSKVDNTIYAMKLVSKTSLRDEVSESDGVSESDKDLQLVKEDIFRERDILEEVTRKNVPCVVRMYCSFQTPEHFCFVLNVGATDISKLMEANKKLSQQLSQNIVKFIASRVALALKGLHKLNIVYRDLKTENIMIEDNGRIFLTDLGLAERCKGMNSGLTEFKGTPEYMAPELAIAGVGGQPVYGKAVDWWALGILIYELLMGKPPFSSGTRSSLLAMIVSNEPDYSDMDSHFLEAKNLITQLLKKKPEERLTDSEKIKTDPFFNGIEWGKILTMEMAVVTEEASKVNLERAKDRNEAAVAAVTELKTDAGVVTATEPGLEVEAAVATGLEAEAENELEVATGLEAEAENELEVATAVKAASAAEVPGELASLLRNIAPGERFEEFNDPGILTEITPPGGHGKFESFKTYNIFTEIG